MGLSTVMIWGAAIVTFIVVVLVRAGEINHKAGRGQAEKRRNTD
ncbi:hypothetical protein [Methylomagnum sp.]